MSTLKPRLSESDHLRGSLSAPLSLVEFGDFECPYCGKAYPVVEAIKEALGDRLCFAFRQFPIAGSHPHATLAAEAAECAGAQGRFWEMHRMLYTHQDTLTLPYLEQFAVLLHIDVRQFVRDLASHKYLDRVRAGVRSGAVSGVAGTPSFFINGQRHDGSYDYDSLMRALAAGAGEQLIV
jgi:protein-disulfide isomerase